jgi:hypothetical protein
MNLLDDVDEYDDDEDEEDSARYSATVSSVASEYGRKSPTSPTPSVCCAADDTGKAKRQPLKRLRKARCIDFILLALVVDKRTVFCDRVVERRPFS